MRKRKLIPFSLMPASWGLTGKSREIAEAEYYLTDYELEVRLAEINAASDTDRQLRLIDVDHQYNILDSKEADIARARVQYSGKERDEKIEEIELEYKVRGLEEQLRNNEINRNEFEKSVANLKKEPYVSVLDLGVDSNNAIKGYIELDWNDIFVQLLHKNGFVGPTDEDVVNQWFNQICRTVLFQEHADLDFGFQNAENNDVIKKSDFTPKGS